LRLEARAAQLEVGAAGLGGESAEMPKEEKYGRVALGAASGSAAVLYRVVGTPQRAVERGQAGCVQGLVEPEGDFVLHG